MIFRGGFPPGKSLIWFFVFFLSFACSSQQQGEQLQEEVQNSQNQEEQEQGDQAQESSGEEGDEFSENQALSQNGDDAQDIDSLGNNNFNNFNQDGSNQLSDNNFANINAGDNLEGLANQFNNQASGGNNIDGSINPLNASNPEGLNQSNGDDPLALAKEIYSTTGGLFLGLAGKAAANGLPEMGSKMSYIVKSGDTLSKIARMIFGDSSRYHELVELSGIEKPSLIYPGQVVYYTLNEQSLAFASRYESLNISQTLVHKGESLKDVARRIYGKTSQWQYLARMNPKLHINMKLEGTKINFHSHKDLKQINNFNPTIDVKIQLATSTNKNKMKSNGYAHEVEKKVTSVKKVPATITVSIDKTSQAGKESSASKDLGIWNV